MITNIFTKGYIKYRIRNDSGIFNDINDRTLIRRPSGLPVNYNDYASYSGLDFVERVYKALVGRYPDKKGQQKNLSYLKRGYPKSALFYLIGRSPESVKYRAKRIKIKSYYKLALKYYLYKSMEPFLNNKKLKQMFEKARYNFRYGKYK